MLDEYLKRDDVKRFINELKTNERYFLKNKDSFNNRLFYISNEIALYIFYEALFKYKIIIEDIYLFDEYLDNLEKIYKKLDNYDDILLGINKLIGRMTILKLDIKNIDDKASRDKVITYIYNKYISEGYYIHGINSSYVEDINNKGFIPEEYNNYYDRFIKLNNIFLKYNVINIINKDFNKHEVYYTDDFLMGCYYSSYAPMFYYKFLTNEDYFGKLKRQDAFLMGDFNPLNRRLRRFISNNMFSDTDSKFIMDLVKDEWDLIHRKKNQISLILVKRSNFKSSSLKLEDCLNDNGDLYDVIDRVLSPKQSSIPSTKSLEKVDIINLDGYYDEELENYELEIDSEDEYYKYKEEEVSNEFLNVYGKASVFLILGSLLITLGVIITVFMLVRGL